MKIEFNTLKISAIAIITGAIIYVVTATMSCAIMVIIEALYAYYTHHPNDPISINPYFFDIPVMVAFFVIDLFCILLSGYITGIIAKGYWVQNTIIVSIPVIIYGILFMGAELPPWFHFLLFIFTPLCIYLGMDLAKRHNTAKN